MKRNTIFVSIPNYRDEECSQTLNDIFDKAKNPSNIFVGVFDQIDESVDTERCFRNGNLYNHNIRTMKTNYLNAKGPLYARRLIFEKLYNNETYILMIDAHSQFSKHWDETLINMLEFLKNTKHVKKPIISSYPPPINYQDKSSTSHICTIKSGNELPQSFQAYYLPNGKFRQTYFIAAGFLFTLGDFVDDINLDPRLEHIFNGEEIYLSLLAFTNGWDVFSPAYNVLYHRYKTSKDKYDDNTNYESIVDDSIRAKRSKSLDILKKLLIDDNFRTNYPLGTERSLKDFWSIINYDTSNKNLNFNDRWNAANNTLCSDVCSYVYP